MNSSVHPPPSLTPPVTEALVHFAFLVDGGNIDGRHSLVLKCPVVMRGGEVLGHTHKINNFHLIFLLSINLQIPPEEFIVERAGIDSLAMGEE